MKMLKKGRKSQGGGGDVYKEWKLFCEKEKKVSGGGGGGGGRGQGRCERRSEAFVKIQKKKFFFLGGGGGGQGGCELRSKVFVKIQKKKLLGMGNVNQE